MLLSSDWDVFWTILPVLTKSALPYLLGAIDCQSHAVDLWSHTISATVGFVQAENITLGVSFA